MSLSRALVLMALLGGALSDRGVAQEPVKDASKEPLKELSWLSGDWELRSEKVLVEERWTAPAGRKMLGVSRTIARGDTVAFEFLRIEARADGGVYYVAQPGGKPPVDFKWNGKSTSELVFENPKHDFPKRISYRRNEDGSVTARVEGGTTGEKAQEFRYSRPKV